MLNTTKTVVSNKQAIVSNNGRKKVAQELIRPTLVTTLFCSFLGVSGFIKTLFWSIGMGFYGFFFNFRNKKSRWVKWNYVERFARSFGVVWYSYPNPKDGQNMFPGRAFFYGLFLPKVEVVRRYAKSWKALDPIYNYEFGKDLSLHGYLTDWWYRHRACQAVRNRLLLAESILTDKLVEVYERNGSVRLLSIACGAAQAVINAVSELKRRGINVRVTLIDFDPDALEYARRMANEKGVSELLETKRVNMFRNHESVKGNFDVVEVIGFLDYLNKNNAKELVSYIKRELLSPGGYFLTANIMFNWDWLFVRWNINWWMIYRTPSQFANILVSGGFLQKNIVLTKEAHKVHCIAVCKNGTTLEV